MNNPVLGSGEIKRRARDNSDFQAADRATERPCEVKVKALRFKKRVKVQRFAVSRVKQPSGGDSR